MADYLDYSSGYGAGDGGGNWWGDDQAADLPPGSVTPTMPPGMDPREFFLQQTPGYGFAFKEGQRAVQTGAAARGTLLTGGTLKALARYGTGIADQLYGDTINRYLSLADLGARVSTAQF